MQISQLIAGARAQVRVRDEGQGLAEYALILGLIAVVSIIALMFLGSTISGALSTVGSTL